MQRPIFGAEQGDTNYHKAHSVWELRILVVFSKLHKADMGALDPVDPRDWRAEKIPRSVARRLLWERSNRMVLALSQI